MSEQQKRGPHRWQPGVSGNPKGRPPKGNALTDAIRAKVDTDELVDIALELARNGEAESTRLQALAWLRDSGYTRPAEKHEIAAVSADEVDDEAIAEMLTDEQLDALDALDAQRAAILARAPLALASGDVPEHLHVVARGWRANPLRRPVTSRGINYLHGRYCRETVQTVQSDHVAKR